MSFNFYACPWLKDTDDEMLTVCNGEDLLNDGGQSHGCPLLL